MLFPALLILLGSTAPGRDVAGDPSRGGALLKSCQAELRLVQAGPAAVQEDLVSGSYCVGYVNGFLGGLAPAGGTICIAQTPMISVVEVYVRFLEGKPQLVDEDKRVGLRQALEASFPCPAAGTSTIDLHVRSGHQNRL